MQKEDSKVVTDGLALKEHSRLHRSTDVKQVVTEMRVGQM